VFRVAGRLALVFVAGIVLGWTSRDSAFAQAQRRTPMVMTRIFTGPDGQARTEPIEMLLTPSATAPTTGTREASQSVAVTQLTAVRTSPGYVEDWHPVGRRQYVVMISGRREIEVAGGKKIALAPGSMMLVEDTTGKGHVTRGVGADDAISLVIPIAESK
jgi:hypothetical protein